MYRIVRVWRGEDTFAVYEPSDVDPEVAGGQNLRQVRGDEKPSEFATVNEALQVLVVQAIRRERRIGDGYESWTAYPFYIVDENGKRV